MKKLIQIMLLLIIVTQVIPIIYAEENEAKSGYNIKVYVVCLDGVPTSGIGKASRVFEGVSYLASRFKNITYRVEEFEFSSVFDSIPVSVVVYVINDWMAYRLLVEYAHDVMILNAHGEILPVPSGYDADGWVDMMADAMHYRNVTWIHVAGYPLRYYWMQDEGRQVTWEEEGFKRLMSHIGIQNATCWPPKGEQHELVEINPLRWIFREWFYDGAYLVELGYPLNATQFKGHVVQPNLYGSGNWILVADAIKFVENNETQNFGFYMHFGGGQTYLNDPERGKTDRDFWVACMATYVAIRSYVMKNEALKTIYSAETAIYQAQRAGRTKGLEKAINLLNEAKNEYYINNWYEGALRKAKKALTTAEATSTMSFFDVWDWFIGAYGQYLAFFAAVAHMMLVSAVAVRRERNRGGRKFKVVKRVETRRFYRDFVEVIQYPVLLGLLAFDLVVVLPSTFVIGYRFGFFIALAFFIFTQSPIQYLIVREIVRQSMRLPMSEAWETSPEKWQKTVDDYVASFRKKMEDKGG
jgi:hypothetical protein